MSIRTYKNAVLRDVLIENEYEDETLAESRLYCLKLPGEEKKITVTCENVRAFVPEIYGLNTEIIVKVIQ